MALLLVQLGPQTAQVLGILGLLVDLTGLLLAGALIVIETLTVLFRPAFDIPVFTMVNNFFAGWLEKGATNSF